jgi:hypothetical protein
VRFKSAGAKAGGDNAAPAHFYQNTFASKEVTSSAFSGSSGGGIGALTFRNNVFVGGLVAIAGPSDGDFQGTTFNYNVVDSSTTGRLLHWGGEYLLWSNWTDLYGMEANGAQDDPRLASFPRPSTALPAFDARLRNTTSAYPSNPAVRAGQRLPGINYGLGGKRYATEIPNIGSKGCYDCYYSE